MPSAPEDVVYGIARIDASGRICERAVIAALGWPGGDLLTFTADAGVVTARRDPGGMVTLPTPAAAVARGEQPRPMTASGIIYQVIARRGRECEAGVFPHRFRHHFSHTWLPVRVGAADKASYAAPVTGRQLSRLNAEPLL